MPAHGEQGQRIKAATRLEGGAEFPGLVIDLEPCRLLAGNLISGE